MAAKYGRTLVQAQKMLDDMTAIAAKDGLDYHFELAQAANTFDSHRVLHLAADHGVQSEVGERIFAAKFTEGELLSDHETLVRLAVEVVSIVRRPLTYSRTTATPSPCGRTRSRPGAWVSPVCRSSCSTVSTA